ncbi:MAG: hypothetical protein HUJ70_14260 [Pseudobutyrivibrio sp.]|nr:hypothetical protein [Pseudobutyrivibrio sp.]
MSTKSKLISLAEVPTLTKEEQRDEIIKLCNQAKDVIYDELCIPGVHRKVLLVALTMARDFIIENVEV